MNTFVSMQLMTVLPSCLGSLTPWGQASRVEEKCVSTRVQKAQASVGLAEEQLGQETSQEPVLMSRRLLGGGRRHPGREEQAACQDGSLETPGGAARQGSLRQWLMLQHLREQAGRAPRAARRPQRVLPHLQHPQVLSSGRLSYQLRAPRRRPC